MKNQLTRTILLAALMILYGISPAWPVQKGSTNVLDIRVSNFKAKSKEMGRTLDELGESYHLLVGVEVIPMDPSQRSKLGEGISVQSGTVRDVLDAAVKSDPIYRWEERRGVINVAPKGVDRSFLETRVSTFQVNEKNRSEAIDDLVSLPEIQATLTAKGLRRSKLMHLPAGEPDYKLPRFSLMLHDVSAQDALNEILRASKSHFWVVSIFGDKNESFLLNIW